MKKCSYCGREYPDAATVCVLDKHLLGPTEIAPVNPIAQKPPASESMGTQVDHTQDESAKLKRRAKNLTFVALFVVAAAIFCLFGSAAAVGADDHTCWVLLFLASGLVSTAVLLFFFAQLFHIRALLAKKQS